MSLQRRIDRGVAWIGVASLLLGILDLVSTLACLQLWVTTADFGTATVAAALLPILDRLGGAGLGASIVRDPDAGDDAALSTICWLGVAVSLVVLAALALARPLLAGVFADPVIASLLVAFGARLVVQNASVVPEALMRRELRYRELSTVRVVAALADTAVKLGAAAAGLHVWCFALGPIANTLVNAIGIQLCLRWRPRLAFRRDVAARALRFAAAVSGGELLYYVYTSADYLVIARVFGDAAVGAYRIAYELVLDVVRLVSMVTAEVAYPTFVRLAADRQAVAAQLVRFTRQNLIALAPFLVFVAVEADDLLAVLYPPLPPGAVTAARVLCLVGGLRALGFVLPPLLAGAGHAVSVLGYNALATVVLPIAFVIGAHAGEDFVAVAWAWAAGYPIAFGVLLAMALGAARLGLAAYLRGIVGILVCTAGAAAAGELIRQVAPVRIVAVAVAVVASYGLLLWRIERVTPRAIVRSFRT